MCLILCLIIIFWVFRVILKAKGNSRRQIEHERHGTDAFSNRSIKKGFAGFSREHGFLKILHKKYS